MIVALISGIILGTLIGVFIMSLVAAAKNADNVLDMERRQWPHVSETAIADMLKAKRAAKERDALLHPPKAGA